MLRSLLLLSAPCALCLSLGARPAASARLSTPSMAATYTIAPSILSADFAQLGKEVTDVLAAGADTVCRPRIHTPPPPPPRVTATCAAYQVHFDVMDNHYVPNLTIGPMVCKALRNHGVTAPIDVHLMVSPVDRIIGE